MADLKTQLKNVAFGGSWSEDILRSSELDETLKLIEHAAEDCTEYDVRTAELMEALEFISGKIEKGHQLKAQFLKAVMIEHQDTRLQAAKAVLKQMQAWAGKASRV